MKINMASYLRWAMLVVCAVISHRAALAVSNFDADPGALRVALFNAAASSDQALVDRLCSEHESTIFESFKSWRMIPDGLRGDPAAVKRYGEGLLAIATHFERRGNRTLIGILVGHGGNNKMLAWMRIYNDAELLLDQNRCPEVIADLEPIADEMDGWIGTSIESLAPRVHGMLGVCHSRLKNYEKALKWTYSAYELCVKFADTDGIIAYSSNMAEIYRTQGDDGQSREWLDATAGVMESAGREAEARALRADH